MLTTAASTNQLATTVVTCPGWTIRQMAEHVLGIFRWSGRIVGESIVEEAWRLDMDIDYPQTDDEVVPHFHDSVNEMSTRLRRCPARSTGCGYGVPIRTPASGRGECCTRQSSMGQISRSPGPGAGDPARFGG